MLGYYLFLLTVEILHFDVDASLLCDGMKENISKNRFGSKTSYNNAEKGPSFWDDYVTECEGCSPTKVWLLMRHGTRFPLKEDFPIFSELPILSDEILVNHFQGRGCITEKDVFEFSRWVAPYTLKDGGELQEEGYEELYSIGKQWQNMFPEIFEFPFDKKSIKIDFTIANRTGQSAYHFLRGMYGDDAIGNIPLPKPHSPNFVLRFHKNCPLWLKEVFEAEKTYKERTLFEAGQDFQAVLHAVSERLGYVTSLKKSSVLAMYEECRYEVAWFPHGESIWCKPFTSHDFKVLEYHQDLKFYYEDGNGTPLNKEIACKTLSDLYLHLRNTVASDDFLPKGVLYFSHDKVLMKVFAALGIFTSDQPLTHNAFHSVDDRAFRSSFVTPFAAHMGVVLYKCGGAAHKVGVLFEGNPIKMPHICPDFLCPWEKWEQFLKPTFENCDISRICMMHDEL